MKRKSKWLAAGCCLALVLCLAGAAWAAEAEPNVGLVVGNVKFPKPMSDEDAKYLGLAKAADFTLKDIKSPYVLVESFNTT